MDDESSHLAPFTIKMKTPVAILVRVSTVKQETARQISELTAAATAKGWNVVEVIEETITGRADANIRPGLARITALMAADRIRKVMVHEVSRLSRRPAVVHQFVEDLEAAGVSLYWHAQGIETLLADGKRNPAAAIMLALLAELARAETDTLRERVKSGLAEAKRNGVRLGRPEGTLKAAAVFLRDHQDVVKYLERKHTIRDVVKLTGKAMGTVQKVKHALKGGEEKP
jgi:DNA invertase Pin-like site-specific DNA recombinase